MFLVQDIYNATAEQYSNVSFVKEGRNVLKSVATKHRATDTQSQAPSNRWIENGSYFRLSSVSLGYTFGKIGNWINSLKLYATCNNVFTITGYSGRDPEINLGGLGTGHGQTYQLLSAYPFIYDRSKRELLTI